jgi:hypothetical protein
MEFTLTAQKQKTNPKAVQKPNSYLVKKPTVVPKERISRILLTKKMFIILLAGKRSGWPQLLSSKRIV